MFHGKIKLERKDELDFSVRMAAVGSRNMHTWVSAYAALIWEDNGDIIAETPFRNQTHTLNISLSLVQTFLQIYFS